MGKRYIQHDTMCGCERCARAWECDTPSPVFEVEEDPEILECGCSVWNGCDCARWDGDDYDDG